jgi:alkylation response protein AidB-like acyl-CoA dehydrogenase
VEWCAPGEVELEAATSGADGNTVREWLQPRLEMGVAVIALGVATTALAAARSYAETRYQGGDVISTHAAVRALLADSARRLATAALAVSRAQAVAPAEEEGAGSLAVDAATAAAERIASDALPVHGGYGYMHEYGAEKRLRDAKTLAVLLRSPPASR